MATVNYSVPDDVKKAFDRAFARRNKSAVIAGLMKDAVAREERVAGRRGALRRIAARRRTKAPLSESAIRKARETDRP